ncbi:unnamed protein product [Malus baccata var. baccata]
MDVKCISLAHFPSPNRHAGIPSRPSVLQFQPNFLLRCLRRINHSVAFSSIAALVVTSKTFVIPKATATAAATAAATFCLLGWLYVLDSPNLLWVTFAFRLERCNIFYLINECSFSTKKKKI